MHGLRLQGFLILQGFVEELKSILCKDYKLMWYNLKKSFSWVSFSYFADIPSTSRILKGGNIKNKILTIKTKFSC